MRKKKMLIGLIPIIFLLLISTLSMFQQVHQGDNKLLLETSSNFGIYQLFFQQKVSLIVMQLIVCLIASFVISLTILYAIHKRVELFSLLLLRKLIFSLSINDFKSKYTGSYLGIVWAFIQPIITIFLYWFVFQIGFKSAPIKEFPFVLWLVAGIVPWFFFSDAVSSAANSLLEYSYLVKKVVFQISVLPIVKILSAFFVHLFFLGFIFLIFCLYGFYPNIYWIQLLYYSFCAAVLALGVTYITTSIIPFFRDLSQVILIILQIGMWMTPIMWSFEIVPDNFQWIFKMNPFFYISEGFRDTLIYHVWFFERFNQTFYFWTITILIFLVGVVLFKKLKPHFSDVL